MKAEMDERRAWASVFAKCWMCGVKDIFGLPLETHEIERRSHGPRLRWAHRCNYFRACRKCHEGPLATMEHAKQLAYKKLSDPRHYDLSLWLKIRDPELRAPRRVLEEEVDAHIKSLTEGGYTPWK